MKQLDELRKEIDKVDNNIVELLDNRFSFVKKIAKIKKNVDLYRPDREQKIYEKLDQLNCKHLEPQYLRSIFKEIMSASIASEGNVDIGYLGPKGSFTHQASQQKFGSNIKLTPHVSIKELFKLTAKKKISYAVVPLENSNEGIVRETLDGFIAYPLYIYSSFSIPIIHNLFSNSTSLDTIKTIYSHPQALKQCSSWIQKNLPNVQCIETSSTSRAIEKIEEENLIETGAIGNSMCKEIYNVPLLSENLSSNNNFTRFIVISYNCLKEKANKVNTSILFSLPNTSGTLSKVLNACAEEKLNLHCIESRPIKGISWSYTFYLEFEGCVSKERIFEIWSSLYLKKKSLQFLGTYPLDHNV